MRLFFFFPTLLCYYFSVWICVGLKTILRVISPPADSRDLSVARQSGSAMLDAPRSCRVWTNIAIYFIFTSHATVERPNFTFTSSKSPVYLVCDVLRSGLAKSNQPSFSPARPGDGKWPKSRQRFNLSTINQQYRKEQAGPWCNYHILLLSLSLYFVADLALCYHFHQFLTDDLMWLG